MKVVAVTGGIASGKSEILKEASRFPRVKTVQADELAKKAYRPGTEEYNRIVELLGEGILDGTGGVDRDAVAEIIFASRTRRKQLEEIIHPFVRERMQEIISASRAEGVKVLIFEIPLLFQSPAVDENVFDEIVLVDVDEKTQLERLRRRDGISRSEASSRVEAQRLPDGAKNACDLVISTSGSLEETRESAEKLVDRFLD
ncbi:MAG: dephospho-CoA kinase [Candidatus Bipolaricaulota bacterium]